MYIYVAYGYVCIYRVYVHDTFKVFTSLILTLTYGGILKYQPFTVSVPYLHSEKTKKSREI